MSLVERATAGSRFREAVKAERPLQVIGTICANHALMAKRVGYKAIYLSGGGVAAGSLGLPDLGISNLDDVLTDVRRITDACELPLLVDVDTGFGASAFNIARTVKTMLRAGAAAIHIEDQVGAKRCGHRPGDEPGRARRVRDAAPRRNAEGGRRGHADPRGALRLSRLPRVRAEARRLVRRQEVTSPTHCPAPIGDPDDGSTHRTQAQEVG